MQDIVFLCELFDLYGDLLTERQRAAFSLRYADDLSLSEIAEELSISRQGARDAIRHAEDSLLRAEEKLHVHERASSLSAIADELAALPSADRQKLTDFSQRIRSVLM